MKKITLIFTLLCCIGALSGMEKPQTMNYMQSLPDEIKMLIFTIHGNLDDTVKVITKLSSTNKEFSSLITDLKKFTALAHVLAQKFHQNSHTVAEKFKTGIAKKYLALALDLMMAIDNKDTSRVNQLIEQGVDVNYTMGIDGMVRPLTYAVQNDVNMAMIKSLIAAGAK